jgi:hypothetical protein
VIKADTVLSQKKFSYKMGRSLGDELIEKMGVPPDACWLFCSPGEHLESLVKGVYDTIGTAALIGCTTDGEISTDGFTTGSAVLGGIGSDQIGFEVAVVQHISRDSEKAGRELAAKFSDDVCYIQLFSDGITGNGSAILRGMAAALKKTIPVAGGTSGDAGRFQKTWQFQGDRVLTDAAVAIGFKGDFKLGTGVCSGWAPIGLPKRVTRAQGNVLYELNGESALSVYQRYLGRHAKRLPGVGVEYPLGLIGQFDSPGRDDHLLLRATMSVDWEEESIQFAGEIPEGAMVYLTCGERASILKATEKAVRLAIEEMGPHTELSMVFFYSCMARKNLLGLRTKEEIERVRALLKPIVPVLGFYTYGEYCRVKRSGPSLLHNETATLSVIGS